MRYILLVYENEAAQADLPPDATNHPHWKFAAAARRADVYVSGAALLPTFTATTVRVAQHQPQIGDGPAVNTPLALSGFYVLDVADTRAALMWAAKIAETTGAVEIRLIAARPRPAA